MKEGNISLLESGDGRATQEKLSRQQREPPCALLEKPVSKLRCVIFDQQSHKKLYDKFRICESDRAKKFLGATTHFQDAIFTRTCDIQDVNGMFGADLYCHNPCILKYFREHDLSLAASEQKEPNLKQRVWLEVVNEIELGFEAGKGYVLSAIRDRFNNLCPDDKAHNREIKVLLLNHFQDKITFTSPSAANKSVLVFSRSCEKETLAETIRSVDPVQICAEMIRDTLENHDFGLQDKFRDALDLEAAWSDIEIPDPLLKFFSVLP